MTEEREEWEKNFDGLEKLTSIPSAKLSKYIVAAKAENLRMEYARVKPGYVDIFTPIGQDLTGFWDTLKFV